MDQPVVGDDIIVENLAELIVADPRRRAVIGLRRGVADERGDRAEGGDRLVHQLLEAVLGRDVGGARDRGSRDIFTLDRGGASFAGTPFAGLYYDLASIRATLRTPSLMGSR